MTTRLGNAFSKAAGVATLTVGLAVSSPALATVTTYTSSASFTAAANSIPLTIEDYGSYSAGQTIANPGTLGALSYSFVAGPSNTLIGGIVTNQFNSFTGLSLGGEQSGGAQFFFGGDSVTVNFPTLINAVGVFFNVNPNSGDYTLFSVPGSVSTGSAAYDTSTFVFDGLISTTPFSSITFFSTDSAVGSFNVPEIEYGAFPAPEPITLSLFGAGLAGAVALRRRKKLA